MPLEAPSPLKLPLHRGRVVWGEALENALKEKTKKGLKEERDRTGQEQGVVPFLPSAAMGSGGSSLELCRHGDSGGHFRIQGH